MCLAVTCQLHFWQWMGTFTCYGGGMETEVRVSTETWPWWKNSPAASASTQTMIFRTWFMRINEFWPTIYLDVAVVKGKLNRRSKLEQRHRLLLFLFACFTLLLAVFAQPRILGTSVFRGWAGAPCGWDPFNTLDLWSGTLFHSLSGILLHSLILSQNWKPISSLLHTHLLFSF